MSTVQNVENQRSTINIFGDTIEQIGELTKPSHKVMSNPGKFLVENGLLFKINHEILHPLGLTLAIILNDTNETVGIRIWDERSDPEGVTFVDDTLSTGAKKLNDYMETIGNQTIDSRINHLGYTVQPISDSKQIP